MKAKSDDPITLEAILDELDQHPEAPRRPRRLAQRLGVPAADYPRFRALVKHLRKTGQLERGKSKHSTVVGRFLSKEQGYGFVKLEEKGAADVFVPAGRTGGAMTGDVVALRVLQPQQERSSGDRVEGEVLRIIERGMTHAVGTVEKVGGAWFLEPDGRRLTTQLLLDGVPPGELEAGTKVVAEIVEYPKGPGLLPVGTITEVLGPKGDLATETDAVVHARGIPVAFSEEALAEAKRALEAFETDETAPDPTRIDRRDLVIVTIDPPDAREFDDAISLVSGENEDVILGVHIADVAHFVPEGGPLDLDARERGTSVYFPRRVIPMLPPTLSAGACALKAGRPRRAVSLFITYNAEGEVLDRRFERTVIESKQRLTYAEAQQICDDAAEGASPEVTDLVRRMAELARVIRARRLRRGMLSLDLPEVSLELDAEGHVTDARPSTQEFSHTVIEMFMVEANEAVASSLTAAGSPVVRRVHPDPSPESWDHLRTFASMCGYRMPRKGTDRDAAQRLIDRLRGKPESAAINIALLRSFQRARYSLDQLGHFALASEDYCHFTSPIRRYPDLLVHRFVHRVLLDGEHIDLDDDALEVLEDVVAHCSETERRAEAAEQELRQVLILQHLANQVGESFRGVVTSVTPQGLFVQMPRFLVEGLVARERLSSGWWDVDLEGGRMTDQSLGVTFRIGDVVEVTIDRVDVAHRHLDLRLTHSIETGRRSAKSRPKNRQSSGGRRKDSRPRNRRRSR